MPKTAQPARLIPYVQPARRGKTPETWTIVYREDGVTKRRSTGVPVAGPREHREASEAFAAFLRGDTATASPGQDPDPTPQAVTIRAVLESYQQHREGEAAGERAAYAARALIFFFKDASVASLSNPRCDEYIKWRRKHSVVVDKATSQVTAIEAKTSDGNIRRELGGVLTPAITHAIETGLLANGHYPVKMPAPPKHKTYFLTRSEAARLLWESRGFLVHGGPGRDSRARLHLPLFIRVALYTGQRKEAILDLTWDRVDFVNNTIDFDVPGRATLKKGRASGQPMPRPLRLALWRARTHYATSRQYVIAYNGERVDDIKHGLKSAAIRAGLPRCTAHTLRHTATSWLVQNGVDLMTAGGYIGHADPNTTKRYAHLAPGFGDKAVAVFEQRDRRKQHALRKKVG
jgi:integrase